MIVVVVVMPFILGAPESAGAAQARTAEALTSAERSRRYRARQAGAPARPRTERVREQVAAASRRYRARQKALYGTTTTRTSLERQQRYRDRQAASLLPDDVTS
jgi:hypothetical protein